MTTQFNQRTAYTTYNKSEPVNTQELAKYLYGEWATHEDFIDPEPDTYNNYEWKSLGLAGVQMNANIKPRPKWAALTVQQQEVWNRVAGVALRITSGNP